MLALTMNQNMGITRKPFSTFKENIVETSKA